MLITFLSTHLNIHKLKFLFDSSFIKMSPNSIRTLLKDIRDEDIKSPYDIMSDGNTVSFNAHMYIVSKIKNIKKKNLYIENK